MSDGRASAREHFVGVARAFGGALFFGLPLLLTMEMWWLGFMMDRFRLALFVAAFFPVVVGLSRLAGFERTTGWGEDVRGALVAVFVGFVTAAEDAETSVDYVPPESARDAGLVFVGDPRAGRLDVRVTAFDIP